MTNITCDDCGQGPLLFSCRQFGTGLCHSCGHKRYVQAAEMIDRLKDFLRNDSAAITYQTLGQYRTAALAALQEQPND